MKVELTKSRGEMNFDSNTGIDYFYKNTSGHNRDEQMFRCSLKFILYIFLSILVFSYRQGIHEHNRSTFWPALEWD